MSDLKLSSGTVRAKGRKYQARFRCSYTDASGNLVEQRVGRMLEAKTLAAAKRKLPDVRQEVKESLERQLLADRVYPEGSSKLSAYMKRYIDERDASHAIEPTTAANYRNSAKQIMRHLPKHIEVGKVTAQTVRKMDADLLDDGLSPDTVSKAHRFLKQVLAAAESEGLIAKNPITREVRPPKRQRREADGLDESTRRRLLKLLDEVSESPLTIAIRMSLTTGMRNEEVLGLRWRDIEFVDGASEADAVWGTIHVRRALTTAAGKMVEKGPKSAAGYRDIPLTADLARVLLRRMREVFHAGSTTGIRDLYVLGTSDGRPYNPTLLSREFKQFATLYDIRCVSGKRATFYALRHTSITTMLRAGIDPKTVSSLAGHSKVAETLDIYATTDADAKRHAAAVVAQIMQS